MVTTVKAGSAVDIPVMAGWSASSSDPSVMTATVSGQTLRLAAFKPGSVVVTISIAPDVSVAIKGQVIP